MARVVTPSLVAAVLAATLILPSRAAADDVSAPPPSPHELARTGAGFLALEILGAAVAFAGLSIVAGDPAMTCGWCPPNGLDGGARDLLLAGNPKTPATWSHVLSVGVASALAISLTAIPAARAGRTSSSSRMRR